MSSFGGEVWGVGWAEEEGEDWRDFPVDRALMAGQVDKLGGNGYNLLCSIA